MENLTLENLLKGEYNDKLEGLLLNVIDEYLTYLFAVAENYLKYSNNKRTYKLKFEEIRQDLYDFVKQHSSGIFMKHYIITVDDKIVHVFYFGSLESANKFVNFEKFAEFVQDASKVFKENPNYDFHGNYDFDPKGYLHFLVHEFKKTIAQIVDEGLLNYEKLENTKFLNNQKWNGTKCSYAQLKAQILRRRENFDDSVVSLERVEELSFVYDETTENIVSDKKCCRCLEQYEIGQKLCRMPCRHFFHKRCILKWFKIPSSPQYDPYDDFENSATENSMDSEDFADENDTEDGSFEDTEPEMEEDSSEPGFECPICGYICC